MKRSRLHSSVIFGVCPVSLLDAGSVRPGRPAEEEGDSLLLHPVIVRGFSVNIEKKDSGRHSGASLIFRAGQQKNMRLSDWLV